MCMKRVFLFLILLIRAVNSEAQPLKAPDGFRWEVVEELTDEFNGDTLDTTKWNDYHPHWAGRPPSNFKKGNAFVENGNLLLRSGIRRDPSTVADPNKDVWVDAAVCVSKDWSAKPGYYYEARIKASDLSMSSSFWFRVGKFSEIDVIEHIGHPSNPISKTLGKDLAYQYHSNAFHYSGGKTIKVNECEWFMPNRGRDEYHVYGMWWKDPNTLLMYHNGTLVMTLEPPTPFNENLKMIFDTETFPDYYGPWGRPGLPLVENLKDYSKNTMYVDWVRTYKLVADGHKVACAGVVTCAESGRYLKNVQVKNLGDNTSTLTDVRGEFRLSLTGPGPKTLVFDNPGYVVQEKTITGVQDKIEIRLKPRKMSAASFRWLNYIESESAYEKLTYKEDPAWKFDFKQADLKGDFVADPNIIRRDPTAVIKVGELYYVYYTKGIRFADGPVRKFFPWDQCDLWYATSTDGWTWQEKGLAVARGSAGAYDDASVFTPEILAHEGKYYLVYQVVKAPYVYRVKNTVGMSIADSPDGPWTKLPEPILRPTNNGQWPEEGRGRRVIKKGDFDSHKVHDPCLMYYKNKFYLYYKGERMGEERFYGRREIKWGVAIADKPEGPYVKSEYNPLTNSGHEVCVWHYNGGIALIHTDDGPEIRTIQWAPDGINFEIMGRIGDTPKAFGLYRTDNPEKGPLEGIRWGLCHVYGNDGRRPAWNYLKRFDIVEKP